MKKMLLTVLFPLLFTGCIERGQNLKPIPVHSIPLQKNTIKNTKINISTQIKKDIIKEGRAILIEVNSTNIAPPIKKLKQNKTHNNNDNIFPLSDESKNRISGFFIIIISIIIFL